MKVYLLIIVSVNLAAVAIGCGTIAMVLIYRHMRGTHDSDDTYPRV